MSEVIDIYSEAFASLPSHERHAARRAQRLKNKQAKQAQRTGKTVEKDKRSERATRSTNVVLKTQMKRSKLYLEDEVTKQRNRCSDEAFKQNIRRYLRMSEDEIDLDAPIADSVEFYPYDQHGNPINYTSEENPKRGLMDPSPAEIAARCKQIRSKWTPDEERSRQMAQAPVPVTVPMFAESDISPFFRLS